MNGLHGACTGRLVADPEFKFTANGSPLLAFRIACEEHRQDGQPSETLFIAVSVFGDLAAALNEGGKLRKGGEAYCEGRVKLATWTGADGSPRSGLNLTAWTVTPMGVFGRQRKEPTRTRDMVYRGPARVQPVAAGADRDAPPW